VLENAAPFMPAASADQSSTEKKIRVWAPSQRVWVGHEEGRCCWPSAVGAGLQRLLGGGCASLAPSLGFSL